MSGGIAFAQKNEILIKDKSEVTTVPNNPLAKLMYYLKSVNWTIDIIDLNISEVDYSFISLINDYKNYHLVSHAEKLKIIRVAKILNPTLLEDKVFFRNESLENNSNKFYEINSTEISVAASNEVIIGGVKKKVHKIMFYKRAWMQENYSDPLRELERLLNPYIISTYTYNGLILDFLNN